MARHHDQGGQEPLALAAATKADTLNDWFGRERGVSLPVLFGGVLAIVMGGAYVVKVGHFSSLGLIEFSFLAVFLLFMVFGVHAVFRWLPLAKGSRMGSGQHAK